MFTQAVKQGTHSGFGLQKLIQKEQPSLKTPESRKLLVKYSRRKKISETESKIESAAAAGSS